MPLHSTNRFAAQADSTSKLALMIGPRSRRNPAGSTTTGGFENWEKPSKSTICRFPALVFDALVGSNKRAEVEKYINFDIDAIGVVASFDASRPAGPLLSFGWVMHTSAGVSFYRGSVSPARRWA